MLIEVKVPQLSESVSEATLLAWHKKVGEAVKRDENLIDIETDKVVLELPAPADGVLAKIVKSDGGTVKAGEVIATIDTEGKASAVAPAAVQAQAKAAPAPAEAAFACACTAAGATALAFPSVSMVAMTSPALTVPPSDLTIFASTPSAGAGSSSTTLSVSMSIRFSSRLTASPTFLCHASKVAS